MRLKLLILFIPLVLILTSCQGGPISANGYVGLGEAHYIIEIWANTSCINRGDTLHLRGRLSNDSSESRVFQSKDKPVLDIGVVFGDIRANWSDGKPLTPDLTRLELKPGESKTIEMDWVVPKNAVSGNVGVIFVYSNQPRDQTGASMPIRVAPDCPIPIGP